MNRRQRLMATLRGEAVDRPAVSFYEIGGLRIDPDDADPFNVYHDPSWRGLWELAERETDLIRLRSAVRTHSHEAWDVAGSTSGDTVRDELMTSDTLVENGSRITRTTLSVGGRKLTSVTRRDPNVDTLWTVSHLLNNDDDLQAYLQLPDAFLAECVDVAPLLAEDQELGDRGMVMVDTEDPLCAAATLMDPQYFTIVAFTQPRLFHRLLEKVAPHIWARTEQVAREFPGRLWRIYGAEYATEPFLPSRLFGEYVVRYTDPMVRAIQQHGGYVRLHCHGRLRNVLDQIVSLGVDAIDPIEPPPQGDVELDFVRREYGHQLVLFGNIEVADVELMEPTEFDQLVQRTLQQGTAGEGRGFVLMPSSSPCNRKISPRTVQNYETMVRRAKELAS